MTPEPVRAAAGLKFLEWLLAEARYECDEAQAEIERLREVLHEIGHGNIGKSGTPGPIVAAVRAALAADTEPAAKEDD